jgi:hypothetical protein
MYQTGSWRNFAMTSQETSRMKKVTNELSFPLVTHTTRFGIRFSRYGILKSYSSSEHVMGDWIAAVRSGFWATRWARLARCRIQLLKEIESSFRCLLKHKILIIVTTVMAF